MESSAQVKQLHWLQYLGPLEEVPHGALEPIQHGPQPTLQEEYCVCFLFQAPPLLTLD